MKIKITTNDDVQFYQQIHEIRAAINKSNVHSPDDLKEVYAYLHSLGEIEKKSKRAYKKTLNKLKRISERFNVDRALKDQIIVELRLLLESKIGI